MIEADLLKECIDYLNENNIFYIRMENNIHRQKYRAKANNKYKGFPDLMVIKDSKNIIFVELKIGNEKLTIEQEYYINKLTNMGFACYVCYTFKDFLDIIWI